MRQVKHEQTKKYDLMTIKEAGIYTGLAVKTLYNMVSQRRIPFVKVGGFLLRFDKEHLNDWLKTQTVMPMPSK